jgi:RNase H-like domain found in reverse transcriptase/Integrase zinc binding domain
LVQAGRPVAYMSKKFNSAERNYPTHDRECLGIVNAYREWRCYLEGVPSRCYTDHKPLTQLQTQPQISRRQARWLEFLANFQPCVEYVQGKYNPADVLSRPPHELGLALPDLGQDTSRYPVSGSLVLSLTETAYGRPTRRTDPLHYVNLPAAREGCDTVLWPAYPRPANSATRLHRGADVTTGHAVPNCAGLETRLTFSNQNSTSHSCQPTRMPISVTAILLNVVNPATYHPVLPMLTGAQAREWWLSAYNSDHLFRDPALINRYQLTQKDDFWYYNDKLIVVPALLRQQVLSQCHDALTSAHFGRTKTLNSIQRHFWWPGYRRDTTAYIKNCLSCARNKSAQHKPYGTLSPLPVPDRPWGSVSMDFITDLPMTKHKHDAILVVVCRLTKMAHFIPCAITCTAQQAADLLIQWVFRLHGTPDTFVVDRDTRWRSAFYRSVVPTAQY